MSQNETLKANLIHCVRLKNSYTCHRLSLGSNTAMCNFLQTYWAPKYWISNYIIVKNLLLHLFRASFLFHGFLRRLDNLYITTIHFSTLRTRLHLSLILALPTFGCLAFTRFSHFFFLRRKHCLIPHFCRIFQHLPLGALLSKMFLILRGKTHCVNWLKAEPRSLWPFWTHFFRTWKMQLLFSPHWLCARL